MNEINATYKSLKKSVKWIKVEAKTIKVTQNPGQFYGVVYILTWVKPWRLKENISASPVTWKPTPHTHIVQYIGMFPYPNVLKSVLSKKWNNKFLVKLKYYLYPVKQKLTKRVKIKIVSSGNLLKFLVVLMSRQFQGEKFDSF